METQPSQNVRTAKTSSARRRRPRRTKKPSQSETSQTKTETSGNAPKSNRKTNVRREQDASSKLTGPKKPVGTDRITDIREKSKAFSKNGKSGRMSKEAKDEIRQVQHVLGEQNFKIFKKGKNSTTYGLVMPHFFSPEPYTLVATIPFTYPQQPVKLDPNDNQGKEVTHAEELANIVNNFNSKAHEMSSKKQHLLSQFNFLITQWPTLSSPNYRQKDRLFKEFLTESS
ncbi:LAFA_0D17238g1_1 [Lachancea sp. 'fantastica']|nr:LAFA_0D17238g1_1 [Lachancea sp. 'fantastica']